MCHWSDMDWLPEVLAMDTATGQNVMPLRCWSMPDSSVILTRTQVGVWIKVWELLPDVGNSWYPLVN